MADIRAVTTRVNAVRKACSLAPFDELPKGERHNPCFCPLGRALRKDMGDSFFLAVGTKHIRLATMDASASEIAGRIRQAWGVTELQPRIESRQFITIPLPRELTEFVLEFDAGKLPKFEAEIEETEKERFSGLARRLWNVTMHRLKRMRAPTPGKDSEPSTQLPASS